MPADCGVGRRKFASNIKSRSRNRTLCWFKAEFSIRLPEIPPSRGTVIQLQESNPVSQVSLHALHCAIALSGEISHWAWADITLGRVGDWAATSTVGPVPPI